MENISEIGLENNSPLLSPTDYLSADNNPFNQWESQVQREEISETKFVKEIKNALSNESFIKFFGEGEESLGGMGKLICGESLPTIVGNAREVS